MATEDDNSPGKRRRLQQQYEHGTRSAAQGQFDYATDMYVKCVAGDPGNPVYAKALLENLFKKYNNNKKGGKTFGFKGTGAKASMMKANKSKDWTQVIVAGLDLLQINPWDVYALTTMATACEEAGFDDCQLVYLKGALDANPKDIDVNRRCGRALARLKRFDDAVACWRRVDQLKPGDEESSRTISNLAVERTISGGGYEDAESTKDVRAKPMDNNGVQLTPEQQLEKAIVKSPTDVTNYVELADIHTNNDRFAEAEKVLAKALEISGGELSIRERLEDTKVRRMRAEVALAQVDARTKGTPEAKDRYKREKSVELNKVEIEVYRSRSERNPNNMRLKFELGVRLKRAGQVNEAIQFLQAARGDSKLKSEAHLELGECFQLIKQPKLALNNYTTALESLFERDLERRKLVLYRVGTLSFDQNDVDAAEKYLTELASLDFGFKDVAKWLEKITNHRNNGGL